MINSILRFLLLLILSVSFTFCANDSEMEIYSNATIEDKIAQVMHSQIETEIFTLVNNYRIKNNLSSLTPLNIISSVADHHTDYMIEAGKVSHDNFADRVLKLKIITDAKSVSENVAFGYSTAQGVFTGWLKSPSHKKIIEIASLTHFGISTKTDSDGRNYFTQIFIEK